MHVTQINDCRLSVWRYGITRTDDNREIYAYRFEAPNLDYCAHDIKSGCGGINRNCYPSGTSADEIMTESLLAFLSAAIESYPDRENADLFPAQVTTWAMDNTQEIENAWCDLAMRVNPDSWS